MPITQLLYEPELTTEQAHLRSEFFQQTGYGPSDLLSLNYETRIFMTRNGGRYRVSEDSSIDWIAGPEPRAEERDQWEL